MTAARHAASIVLELASISRSASFSGPCSYFRNFAASTCSSSATPVKGSFALPARWLYSSRQHVPVETSLLERTRALLQSYKQLSKAKLSTLVVLTSAAGYVLGSGPSIDFQGLGLTSLGTFACAACANSLNQVYERVNDSYMQRTRTRPLPAGRLGVPHALLFAAATGVLGVTVLATQTNPTTTALGAANIFLYAAVYTPMKQMTIWNTWVGAIVGAVPPLMGWAAASGELQLGSAVLAAALYFWQLPHFLALAWLCKDDYVRGGFKMISMVDPTGRRTAASAIRNCVYLLPVGFAAAMLGVTTSHFPIENAALSTGLAYFAIKFWKDPTKASARTLFRMSLLYLPVSMACAIAHRLPQTGQHTVTVANSHTGRVEQLPKESDLATIDYVADALRTSILNIHLAFLALVSWCQEILPGGSNDLKCPSKAYGDSLEEKNKESQTSTSKHTVEQNKVD